MKSFSRRQFSKLISTFKWPMLFFIIASSLFLQSSLRGRGGLVEVEEAIIDPERLIQLRKNHLFKYDSTAPTNYSGGHEGWLQRMSKTVAGRLNFKRNGFFVECGALDGVYLSNSLLLEMDYGWTGLLIEADPKSVLKLKGRNRHAWVADVCLSPKPYPMTMEMAGHDLWPEISYIKSPLLNAAHSGSAGFNRTLKVDCYPLGMLMEAVGRDEIDYFSLDVEGMELDVLKSVPFHRLRIKLISVEVRKGQDEEIRKFLEPLGYKRVKQFRIPSDFMHDDLYEYQR